MKLAKIFLVSALLAMVTPVSAKDYYASTFGILSNGTTLNTRSIQKAIDHISANGGGKLIFKVGRYLTGSIHMKSNVTIELSEGAVLVGSTNPYDYDKITGGFIGLVVAYKADNIGIVGKGVIDGQGKQLAENYLTQAANGIIDDKLELGRVGERPKLIYFRECKNVTIKDINMKAPAFWTQTYDQCKNLVVDGITVTSRAYWNNDGLDVVDCEDSVIKNCFIDATDDGICLKSHDFNKMCNNILIHNNVVTSSASGIKFGTAGRGGFKNIKIINNKVYDTYRSAITIQAVDSGFAEDIEVDSLYAENTGNPIFLVVGDRTQNPSGRKSYMKNIYIHHMKCEVPAGKPDEGVAFEGPTNQDNPRNVSPCSIIGLSTSKIQNVRIEDVDLIFPGGGNPYYAKVGLDELDKVPEIPKSYPEFSRFKELPAWGFYIRHAENISFKNVKFTAKEKDYRVAVVADDVKGLSLKNVKYSEPGKSASKQVFTRNTTMK